MARYPGKTKLVIGTRHYLGDEWLHLDADNTPLVDDQGGRHPVDVVADATNFRLSQRFKVVYSQECLEHFSWHDYQDVLKVWADHVDVGGILRIEVPDFLAACEQVLKTGTLEMDRAIQQIIFGGQANKWDFHYTGITHRMLVDDMERMGFDIAQVKRGWEHGWLLVEGMKR